MKYPSKDIDNAIFTRKPVNDAVIDFVCKVIYSTLKGDIIQHAEAMVSRT